MEFTFFEITSDPSVAHKMNIGTTGTAVVSDDDAALDSGTIDGGNQFSIDDTEFTSSAYPNNAGTGVEIYSAHVTGGGMITFFYLTSASDGVDDAVDRIVLLSGSISPGQKIVNFKLLSNTTSIPYVDIPSIVICFTPGTMITTPRGQVPVETLSAGDLVITADNGLQTIRWVGAKRMTGARLMAYPELRPIRIRKNAFGEGLPLRDMWVSPQHRMLVSSEKNLLEHGEQELLVPAKALLNDLSITVDYGIRSTEYIHILFDKHEIIFANGSATESFHPGASALSGIEDAARDELFDIFPELETDPTLYGPSARLSLRVQEGRHQPSPGGIL